MSDAWFHVDAVPGVGEQAALDPREARHAAGARRLAAGDAVTVFDGRGAVGAAVIVDLAGRGRAVTIEVRDRRDEPAPAPAVHVAAALPKGERQGTMIGMLTQLGAASITPLDCARSVARAGAAAASRLERIALEACKQSRRAHAPRIEDPADVASAVGAASARGHRVLAAHPGGAPIGAVAAEDPDAPTTVFVGPEGGFTDDEIAAVERGGGRRVDLGPGILRIETAAVAMVAVLVLGRGSDAVNGI